MFVTVCSQTDANDFDKRPNHCALEYLSPSKWWNDNLSHMMQFHINLPKTIGKIMSINLFP